MAILSMFSKSKILLISSFLIVVVVQGAPNWKKMSIPQTMTQKYSPNQRTYKRILPLQTRSSFIESSNKIDGRNTEIKYSSSSSLENNVLKSSSDYYHNNPSDNWSDHSLGFEMVPDREGTYPAYHHNNRPPRSDAPLPTQLNRQVLKLLNIASYTTVGALFLFLFMRNLHLFALTGTIATAPLRLMSKMITSILLFGNAIACLSALFQITKMKPFMKTMLSFSGVLELFQLIQSFFNILSGNTGYLTREEAVGPMIWNGLFMAFCLSLQSQNWIV